MNPEIRKTIIVMDYAIQLLSVIALFLFGGLWLHHNWGMPMWGVIVLFFIGVTAGLGILYKRGVEEVKHEEYLAKQKKLDEEKQSSSTEHKS